MINFSINIEGEKNLDNHIEFIKKMLLMKTDKNFQKYIQEKCLDTVKETTSKLMRYTGSAVETYKNNHKIKETNDGFILYNDTVVNVDSSGYGGEFPLALAFEYGTGIVGSENPKIGAWTYNVNNYEKGWYYFKNDKINFTRGYEGMEIYRNTAIEIKKRLKSWVINYYTKNEV